MKLHVRTVLFLALIISRSLLQNTLHDIPNTKEKNSGFNQGWAGIGTKCRIQYQWPWGFPWEKLILARNIAWFYTTCMTTWKRKYCTIFLYNVLSPQFSWSIKFSWLCILLIFHSKVVSQHSSLCFPEIFIPWAIWCHRIYGQRFHKYNEYRYQQTAR